MGDGEVCSFLRPPVVPPWSLTGTELRIPSSLALRSPLPLLFPSVASPSSHCSLIDSFSPTHAAYEVQSHIES